jgi:hypothetical protein
MSDGRRDFSGKGKDWVSPLVTDGEGRPLPSQHAEPGRCITCDNRLGKPGGYGGTGMCGPCCTGEAETVEEYGETW